MSEGDELRLLVAAAAVEPDELDNVTPVHVTYEAFHMMTGDRLMTLPSVGGRFSSVLNGFGDIAPVFDTDSDEYQESAADVPSAIEPWLCGVAAVTSDGNVLEAGPVVGQTLGEDGSMRVHAFGLRRLFQQRRLVDPALTKPAQGRLMYSGWDLGTIGKKLIEFSMSQANGSLPLVLEADRAGTHEREYPGYEAADLDQRLSELTGVTGGPDIVPTPRLRADMLGIEWVLRTGTQSNPMITTPGAPWVWDGSAVKGASGGIAVVRDGADMVTQHWATGQGMQDALLMAHDTNDAAHAAGIPLLQSVDSFPNVGRQSTLNTRPPRYLAQGAGPWTTWTVRANRDLSPRLGEYRVGDWVRVYVPRTHPLITYRESGYMSRIAAFAGEQGGDDVELYLRPTMEAR